MESFGVHGVVQQPRCIETLAIITPSASKLLALHTQLHVMYWKQHYYAAKCLPDHYERYYTVCQIK